MSSRFFPSFRTNQELCLPFWGKFPIKTIFFILLFLFLFFIVIFNLFPFFPRIRPRIESHQRHFEESVIICVERTWPIKHLLSSHESFVPNHVEPLSPDFFYKWQCTKKLGFKNICNEEYELYQPKETYEYIFTKYK